MDEKVRKTSATAAWLAALRHLLCGAAMGTADIIPGVSGGTVALVLGIYTRLVTAISHVDATFVQHIVGRRWREGARHIDLAFLIALAIGIGIGILTMGVIIHELLADDLPRQLQSAAFVGMITASILLVVP